MAQQVLHLLERCAPLDGPGREGVPQVVEVEVDQLRAPTARSQAVRKWSQRRVPKTRPALFEPRRASTASARPLSRYLAALATLGAGAIEPDDARGAVHALPGQPEHLTAPHPGEERELHQVGQVDVPGLPAGVQ